MTTVHHDPDITWPYDQDMAITTRILPTQHLDGLQKYLEFTSLEFTYLLQVHEHLDAGGCTEGLKYLQIEPGPCNFYGQGGCR